MEYKILQGSVVNTTADFIVHQVNCKGEMNSGVALAIKKHWPEVEQEYREYCRKAYANGTYLLGTYQKVDKIINLFGKMILVMMVSFMPLMTLFIRG